MQKRKLGYALDRSDEITKKRTTMTSTQPVSAEFALTAIWYNFFDEVNVNQWQT